MKKLILGALVAACSLNLFAGIVQNSLDTVPDNQWVAVVTRNLPGNVVTNQQLLTLTTFVAGSVGGATNNGVFLYSGISPSALKTNSAVTILNDPAPIQVRDASQFKWVDNNGNVYFLMSYGAYWFTPATGGSNTVGIARSYDGGNSYSPLGYINFGAGIQYSWSAKFAANSTNGLILTAAIGGVNPSGPTNNCVADISFNNFTNWSNLRVLGTRTDGGAANPEQSSGIILYQNGLYNYFDTVGQQHTNSTLGPTGWKIAYSDNTGSAQFANSGPTVIFLNGRWYWFATDSGVSYITSSDLNHWVGTNGSPVYFAPYDLPSSLAITGLANEGTAIVRLNSASDNVSGYFSGSFTGTHSGNGSGLTNLSLTTANQATNYTPSTWTPVPGQVIFRASNNWEYAISTTVSNAVFKINP